MILLSLVDHTKRQILESVKVESCLNMVFSPNVLIHCRGCEMAFDHKLVMPVQGKGPLDDSGGYECKDCICQDKGPCEPSEGFLALQVSSTVAETLPVPVRHLAYLPGGLED